MTLKQLQSALAHKDANRRADAVRAFGKTAFGVDALPVLRRALADPYVSTVINAAECIGKLGPAALDSPHADAAMPTGVHDESDDLPGQLMLAGGRRWAYSGYANCYSACLGALVKLEFEPEYLVEFIHDNIGLNSQDAFIASATALKTIGTPEALDLLNRAAEFWRLELNKTFTKKLQSLLARPAKKAPAK